MGEKELSELKSLVDRAGRLEVKKRLEMSYPTLSNKLLGYLDLLPGEAESIREAAVFVLGSLKTS